MPEFFEVALSQRACRHFLPDPVSDQVVEQVLEAATHAPSAENRQPWVFLVVRDDRQRALLGELTRRAWEGGGRRHSESRLAAGLLEDVDRGATGGVAAAPVMVVVCADIRAVSPAVLAASIFPAVQNLLLAAGALGLGSALTTLPLAFSAELAEGLGLPDEIAPMAVVPLGRPAHTQGTPRRRPVADVTHRERFGAGW